MWLVWCTRIVGLHAALLAQHAVAAWAEDASFEILGSFNISGIVWQQVRTNGSTPYFYNTVTGISTWADPRRAADEGVLPQEHQES
jgi:hypothetical protein